jgi:hypothetical protein
VAAVQSREAEDEDDETTESLTVVTGEEAYQPVLADKGANYESVDSGIDDWETKVHLDDSPDDVVSTTGPSDMDEESRDTHVMAQLRVKGFLEHQWMRQCNCS